MLFKNLPAAKLTWLLPARVLLELLAVVNYAFSGKLQLATAPIAALTWVIAHPLNLLRRRINSRSIAVPGADQDQRGVYNGSILCQYFFRRRRKSNTFMQE